jgi:hypothetical protein
MVLAIGVFSLLPAVRASASVIPGDTVDVDVVAFNNTTNLVVYVVRPLDITFGTTNTYAGGDVNGQNVTVSSSEVIGGTTTTDTLVISVPTNFDVNSSAYNGLQFDIAVQSGATDPINLSAAINPATLTASGFTTYGTSNTQFTLSPVGGAVDANTGLTGHEGVYAGSSSIYSVGIHEFSLSLTYANPAPVVAPTPEPGSLALLGTGLTAVAGLVRRKARLG